VGFPIRRSSDQSLFAAPRRLSQRTTSFIASQCQGIHRMPLRRLIALIADAHPPRTEVSGRRARARKTILLRGSILQRDVTLLSCRPPQPQRVRTGPAGWIASSPCQTARKKASCRSTMPICKIVLLPGRIETSLVEPDGIEPTTSCLQSTRSPN
jgi:hypothetical protein